MATSHRTQKVASHSSNHIHFFFWLVPKDAFFLWIIYCPFLSAFQMYRHSRLLNEITIRNWNIPTRERETYFDNAHYFNIVKSIYYRHDYIFFFRFFFTKLPSNQMLRSYCRFVFSFNLRFILFCVFVCFVSLPREKTVRKMLFIRY